MVSSMTTMIIMLPFLTWIGVPKKSQCYLTAQIEPVQGKYVYESVILSQKKPFLGWMVLMFPACVIYGRLHAIITIEMKSKFIQWWSTIPPVSTKHTTTSPQTIEHTKVRSVKEDLFRIMWVWWHGLRYCINKS